MSPVKPALTAEEWARLTPTEDASPWDFWEAISEDDITSGDPMHAMAALCLHGQDFGFTREDVALLRFWGRGPEGDVRVRGLLNLADRIEALLPPGLTEG